MNPNAQDQEAKSFELSKSLHKNREADKSANDHGLDIHMGEINSDDEEEEKVFDGIDNRNNSQSLL